MAIDLIKQQALDADRKATQEINFTRNLSWGENIDDNTIMLLIIEELKETILNFLNVTVKVLYLYFVLI